MDTKDQQPVVTDKEQPKAVEPASNGHGEVIAQDLNGDGEVRISEMKGGTVGQRIKTKILDDFFSRKFIILVIAVVAFFLMPTLFPAQYLVISFGIYAGSNVLEKLVQWKK